MRRHGPSRHSGRRVRVLLTCVGRRVELVQAFRDAGRRLGVRLEVHGTDTTDLAPAIHFVDRAHRVVPISRRDYIGCLLKLVEREHIDVLIPTIDTELPKLAEARQRFADIGCRAVVSSPEVIAIGRDKLLTHLFLKVHHIDAPETWPAVHVLRQKRHAFPYQIKPRHGSAGKGNIRVDDVDSLRYWVKRVPEPIVQEFIAGTEYTLDVYVGGNGRVRCVVPRERLEVRSGEVQKARVVKDPKLIELGLTVGRSLTGALGVITVQCIRSADKRIRVIEINPRLGGGAPLAIRAGADFPRWILAEHLGRNVRIALDGYRDGLHMLRYDQSVFMSS